MARISAKEALERFKREKKQESEKPVVTGSTRSSDTRSDALDQYISSRQSVNRPNLSVSRDLVNRVAQADNSTAETTRSQALSTLKARRRAELENILQRRNSFFENRPTLRTSVDATADRPNMTVSRDLVNRVSGADNSIARKTYNDAVSNLNAKNKLSDTALQNLREYQSKMNEPEVEKEKENEKIDFSQFSKTAQDRNTLGIELPKDTRFRFTPEEQKNEEQSGPKFTKPVEQYTPLHEDEYKNTLEYQWARKHPLAAAAVSVGMNPVTGVQGLANLAQQLFDPEKLDANEMKGAILQNSLRSGLQRGVNDNLAKAGLDTKDDGITSNSENVSNFLTGTALDAVNSTVGGLTLGAANLAAMSGSAGAQSLLEGAKDDKKSRNQMMATAASSAILEALFEKVSLDNLIKNNMHPSSVKDLIKNFQKSFFVEGTEEFNTDVGNDIADIIINRENSEAGKLYTSYLNDGLSVKDALLYTIRDRLIDAGVSFLGGGLSGGFSAGTGGVVGTYKNSQALNDIENTYVNKVNMYRDIRDSADPNSKLYKLASEYADKLNRGENLTPLERGFIANAMDESNMGTYDTYEDAYINSLSNPKDPLIEAIDRQNARYFDEYGEDYPNKIVKEIPEGETIIEPDIVSQDESMPVEESSTQSQIDDIVNAAVDELIRQQNIDTSESTPDEAKKQTETLVNAIKDEDSREIEFNSKKLDKNSIDNVSQETEVQELNNANIKSISDAKDIIRKNDYAVYGIRIDDREFSEGDILPRSHEWLQDDPDGRGVEDPSFNPDYGLWDNGELEGTSVLEVDADNIEDMLDELKSRKYNYGHNIYLVAGDFATAGMDPGEVLIDNAINLGSINYNNNGFTSDTVNSSDKLREIAEDNIGETTEPAAGSYNMLSDIETRSNTRFSNDPAAKSVYDEGFIEFYDYFETDVARKNPDAVVRTYDENMSKVYDLGLQGKSMLSVTGDEAFGNFVLKFGDLADKMWQAGYNRSKTQERETEKTFDAETTVSPQLAIADKVSEIIASGKDFSSAWLFNVADKAYGGTQADGTYTVKDAYDGMELGINKYLMSADFIKNGNDSLKKAKQTLTKIQDMLRHIPTQTKRTTEMEQYQQFSTPANLAYTAAWLANIDENDTVLEPSAGIGGLALFGKAWGAKVYANELSKRRLAFLDELGLDETFNENAEHINDILPDYVKPTVVLMNPPFSSTAGRTSKNNTANAKSHIEQALDRLSDNGRLVAIVGKGMSNDAPSFRTWFNDLRKEYDIKANVRIDGSNFKKNGTTFDDQLIIIDKTGPQEGKTLTGEYKELKDVLTDLEGIRNERIISGSDRGASEPLSVSSGDTGLSDRRVQSGESTGDSGMGDLTTDRRGTDTEVARGDEQSRRESGRSDSERSSEGTTETEKNRNVSTEQRERDKGRVVGTDVKDNESDSEESGGLRLVPVENKKKEINIDSTYTNYAPSKVNIKGAKPHPGVLVESAAMGAVEPPEATYVPHLPQELIESGKPSAAQLENIVYAGQAHQTILPNGSRKGYFIGDGTGVGKGVQLASIILDNFNQGRKKAIWISKNPDLMVDAQRDWGDLGQNPKDVFSFQKVTAKGKNIPDKDGILFSAYSTLGHRKQAGIDQIKKWAGKDFDGVIVLDEAHEMKSAIPVKGKRGTKKPAEQALWGIELQKQFPNARVVYATATGASDISQYAYLDRLGLWGPGTGFDSFQDFASSISSGGLAAMELVARDMKSMGDYMARSISYDGVQYDTITHPLNEMQSDIYNKMSEGWRTVLRNVEKAIEITGADSNARKNARGRFWGTLQTFYNQILTSMSLPSVITDMENELKNGRSIVIQLVNTNASQTDKKLAAMKDGDLENLDLTPSEALIDYLRKAFPVQAFEKYEDEDGNIKTRPVVDSKGQPVNDKRAVALRDKLIEDIGKMQVPDGPLEMILDHFGVDKVAEVTGRTRRVVYKKQSNGRMKRVTENWSKAKGEADANAFQDGKKRILIFSEAGGTGKSYHADRRAKNQQQRVHYILQPGWKADSAIQGLGRTHRTNEASQPIYKLVTTDVMGQKRFTSTIAKRLNQMGALTKGQRDAGSGIFSEKDNLETPLAADALETYYRQAGNDLLRSLGINIYDANGRINDSAEALRDVSKFLNRILALDIEDQNKEFEKFYSILEEKTEQAIKNGTLDRGLETIKADKIETIDEKEVYKDKNSSTATKYVQLKVSNKPELISYDRIMDRFNPVISMVRLQDGSVRAVFEGLNKTDPKTGKIVKTFYLESPIRGVYNHYSENTLNERTTPIPKKEWEKAWEEETKKAPEYIDDTVHMLTGTLLPIWKQLPENNTRVMRIVTDDGKQYLGRIIDKQNIDSVLGKLGTERTKENYTPKDVMKKILNDNQEVSLTFNKLRLKRSRVANDYRIEVLGNNLWSLGRYYDVFSEKINGKDRYFVPTGERGEKALEKLFAANAIRDIAPVGTSDDVAYSVSKKKGSSNKTVSESVEKPTKRELAERAKAAKEERERKRQEFEDSLRPDKWEAEKNQESDAVVENFENVIGQFAHDMSFQYTPGKRYTKGKSIGGFYSYTDKGIRTKIANDFPAFCHENGHLIADRIDLNNQSLDAYDIEYPGLKADILKAYSAEYDEDDYPADKHLSEGIAEYFRHYCENKDTARIDYPVLTDFFLKKLGARDLAIVNNFANKVNAIYAAGASEITQHVVKQEDSLGDYRTLGEKGHDAYVRAQIYGVDSNYGMKDFDLTYGTNIHQRATNAEYIDGTISYAMENDLYDLEGNYICPGLKRSLKGVNLDPKSKEFEDFGDYLVVRHAPERLALGLRTYADDRQNNAKWMENRQAELEAKYPNFVYAAENLDRFQKNLLENYALKYGLITKDAYDRMLKDYPHYVPFFRAGFKTKGNALRNAHGSGRTIINPVDNIITSTMKIMKAGSQQAIKLTMRDAALQNNADALFMEKIPDPQVAQKFDMRGIKESLHNKIADINVSQGVDPQVQDLLHEMVDNIENTLVKYETGKARKDLNEIVIMVEGKPEFWKINDENLFLSLTSMDYRSANILVNLYGKLTRFMTSNTTGNNFIWSIFSNSPRDFQTLLNYSDTKNVFKLAKLIGDSYLQSTKSAFGLGTVSDYYAEFLAMGAKGSPVWAGDKSYVKDMRKLVTTRKGFNPSYLNPLKYARFISETIEMGPRYATYRLMRERGMDPQKAFYEAMDITTNFRKKGIVGKELNKTVQFFNANVQGLDHAIRYYSAEDLKGKPKAMRNKAIRARMTFLVATSLLMAALQFAANHRDDDDKEEYNLLSNYMKNYYFCIHRDNGKFIRIPKNHELSVLESLFERCLEYYADNNEYAFDEYFDYFAEQVMPPIISELAEFPVNVVTKGAQPAIDDLWIGIASNTGVIGVAMQTAMNKNYMGSPIVKKSLEGLAPKQQYDNKTTQLAYLIGQALNISPKKLDHFAENVLGYIWDTQGALFPIDAGDVKGERDIALGVSKKYTTDNLRSNNISNWIYDKSAESQMQLKSDGDNLLEASLDQYMKTRYANYDVLWKNEEETEENRKERKKVLDELIDYRKGEIDDDLSVVSSLVEETGDKSYLPSALSTTFKNGKGGEDISLTSSEYMEFQNTYEDLYLKYMNESISKAESADKWNLTRKEADDAAKNQAKNEILKKKGIEPKFNKEKAVEWLDNRENFDTFIDKSYEIKTIKEGDGETKDKQDAVRRELQGLSEESKLILWNAAGWKASTLHKK